MISLKERALASVLFGNGFVFGQQVIFLPAFSSIMSPPPPFHPESPEQRPGYERRLEPYRRQIRESCHSDAMTYCPRDDEENPCPFSNSPFISLSPFQEFFLPNSSSEEASASPGARDLLNVFDRVPPPPHRSFPPLFTDAFFDEDEDPLASIFDEMLGFSLRAFDAAEEIKQNRNKQDILGVNDVSSEQTAEDALDMFVASLFQHAVAPGPSKSLVVSVSSEPEPVVAVSSSFDEDNEVEELAQEDDATEEEEERVSSDSSDRTTSKDISVEILPDKLAALGNDMLVELRRRRLSEQDREEAITTDPHADVRERLARRLTEYRTDLFYYPDGSVTLYTTSLRPSSPSVPISSLSLLEDSTPPILGMGSKDLDECIYSRYMQGDLQGSCSSAVKELLHVQSPVEQRKVLSKNLESNHFAPVAHHQQQVNQQQQQPKMQQQQAEITKRTICIESLLITLTVFSFFSLCALCTGLMDVWNLLLSVTVAMTTIMYGLKSFFITLPFLIGLDWLLSGDEEEEDEEVGEEGEMGYMKVEDGDKTDDDDDDGCHPQMDYVQMYDDRSTPKAHSGGKTLVFVGVPVQVV